MKTNIKEPLEKANSSLLSQCPKCRAVEVRLVDGRVAYQQSLGIFLNLPQKLCYEHKAVVH